MAKQISIRMHQISGTVSGKCMVMDAEDADGMTMPKDHIELFDAMRRNMPEAYSLLLQTAQYFGELDNAQQVAMLQSDVPTVLLAINSSANNTPV